MPKGLGPTTPSALDLTHGSCDVALRDLGWGGWEMAALPCADLENIFPDPPEPSDRVALERGTTGIPEDSGEDSMNCARPQGPKALRGSREGEKPRGQVQINMYSASLQNAPESPFRILVDGLLVFFQ